MTSYNVSMDASIFITVEADSFQLALDKAMNMESDFTQELLASIEIGSLIEELKND